MLPVEVTQADRDLAANIWQDLVARPGECIVERALRRGDMDDSPLIEILARHRLTSRQDGLREALEQNAAFKRTASLLAQGRSTIMVQFDGTMDREQWLHLNKAFDLLASAAALSDISPLANEAAAERVTNGQYATDDFGPVADAARRIASYCEGDARGRVYRAAKQELANDTGALREAGWLSDLRRWAYPNEQDRREIAALKKAARVITQMHAEKAWCSGDVQETLAMIRAALSPDDGEGK